MSFFALFIIVCWVVLPLLLTEKVLAKGGLNLTGSSISTTEADAFSVLLNYEKRNMKSIFAAINNRILKDNIYPVFCQYYVLVAQLKYTKICIKIGYFVNLNMQGKKNFTPQLFVSVNLLDLVPEDNFYRKLLMELDFIKMVFIDFKSSFLSTPIFSILTVN